MGQILVGREKPRIYETVGFMPDTVKVDVPEPEPTTAEPTAAPTPPVEESVAEPSEVAPKPVIKRTIAKPRKPKK